MSDPSERKKKQQQKKDRAAFIERLWGSLQSCR